jgi:hypothetical protein
MIGLLDLFDLQKKENHFLFLRSDPADVLRFFAPMRVKISALYDDLQTATCHGNLRDVLKIEEKLKLLRYEIFNRVLL